MKFLLTDSTATFALCHYRIEKAINLRLEEYRGTVGLEEVKSILSAASSDPCWSADQNVLFDFSQSEFSMSANDVLRWALSLRHAEYLTKGWLVFVVSNSLGYGLIRMLGQWSRNTDRIRIFFQREKAQYWLKLYGGQTPPGFACALQINEDEALRQVV